jgi:16S rRNA (cytosine967-C5)-methyltransferase
LNTRWIAARVITQVLQDGQSLTKALDSALKSVESTQDKAFIQAICYGVCRYYHQLDFILGQLVDKPLKVFEAKALLLIGLYQLKYMRVKPHAAVSETVQAARKLPWARALINAVLRNYLRRQDALENQAIQVKSASLSHPEWLIHQLERDWPEQAESILHENNQPPPMTLRVNLGKTSRDNYLGLLAEKSLLAHPVEFCPSAIIMDNPVPVDKLPNFSEGWVSVQDCAAQLAPELMGAQEGHRVLDICAAPGGKTAHLLEFEPQISELVAVDIDENRMLRVSDNLRRLQLNATLIKGDATNPESWWDGTLFDRILLDAPCSATGVIRRHPDIKLLRKVSDIPATTHLQKQILNAIWPLLKKEGILLYATCSVLKQENEEQIQDFLAQHDDAKELPILNSAWGISVNHGKQVLTGESSMDGFYYARLVKH